MPFCKDSYVTADKRRLRACHWGVTLVAIQVGECHLDGHNWQWQLVARLFSSTISSLFFRVIFGISAHGAVNSPTTKQYWANSTWSNPGPSEKTHTHTHSAHNLWCVFPSRELDCLQSLLNQSRTKFSLNWSVCVLETERKSAACTWFMSGADVVVWIEWDPFHFLVQSILKDDGGVPCRPTVTCACPPLRSSTTTNKLSNEYRGVAWFSDDGVEKKVSRRDGL